MQCDRCGKREATVHLLMLQNGQGNIHHLCDVCANEQYAYTSKKPITNQPIRQRNERCPICGTMLSDIVHSGFVGCQTCYRIFETEIRQMLASYHGKDRHIALSSKQEDLKSALDLAVREERYEAAAKLRDELLALQKGVVG